MTGTLIQRLRRHRGDYVEEMDEAADALEQQAAQIEALKADAERMRSGIWEVADGLRTKANNNTHIKSSTLDSFAADLDALRQEQPAGEGEK